MSYNYDYKEVKRMMLNAMLDISTARDIVRKAGIFPGDGSGGGSGFVGSGNGPSLLATIDPDGSSYTYDSTNHSTFVRYLSLVHDTGLGGFDAGVAYPFSWTVPFTGLYRIDASAGVWRPSHATWQQVTLWARWYTLADFGPDGAGEQGSVPLMTVYDYDSSVLGADDPIVLRGTAQDILSGGQVLLFNLTDGPNNISVDPDPELTRFSVQLIGAPMEEA